MSRENGGKTDLATTAPAAGRADTAATLRPGLLTLSGVEADRSDAPKRGSLVVISGAPADVGQHVRVEREVVVGRESAGLILHDQRSSRQHARVYHDGARYLVEDLASTNGTLLNGRSIERACALADGDRVYIGGTVMKFVLVDDAEATYLEYMEQLAGNDPLTGLPAKHRFDWMLEEAVRTARLADRPLAALMMDLDGLKALNDRYGHRHGEHTISVVGRLVGRKVAGLGVACRFGGDEYCAYLPNAVDVAATAVAESIRKEVEATVFQLDGVDTRVTMSIGYAVRATEVHSAAALIGAADEALYRAKRAGRNRVSA